MTRLSAVFAMAAALATLVVAPAGPVHAQAQAAQYAEVDTTLDPSAPRPPAAAKRFINVKQLATQKGIEIWFVEDHSLPLLAVEFSFAGGSASEPYGKAGLAYMLAGMLDEGAGPYDFNEFQTKLKELSVNISFRADRDGISGSMLTLSRSREQAFDLLRLALTEPRFDEGSVEKVRAQIKLILDREQGTPSSIASDLLFKAIYPDHPYGRPVKGTLDSIKKISTYDMAIFREARLTQQRLKLTVVGDVTPDELKTLVDASFGALPPGESDDHVADVELPAQGQVVNVKLDIPQTVAFFAGPGIRRDDADFIPGVILNYVLGGGGFASRLLTEIREKRGLAYSAGSSLFPLDHSGLFFGRLATRNDRVNESIEIFKAEVNRVREEGITEQELEDAKRFLTGSYALSFDSNSGIAGNLLGYHVFDLDPEYVNRRNELIRAVTIDDIRRVAKRMPTPDSLTIVVVGNPTKGK